MQERGATYCMPGGYGQSTGVRYFFWKRGNHPGLRGLT